MITKFDKNQKLLVLDLNSPLEGQQATALKWSKFPGVITVKGKDKNLYDIPVMYLQELVTSDPLPDDVLLDFKYELFNNKFSTIKEYNKASFDGATGESATDVLYSMTVVYGGGRFVLYKEAHHTSKDITKAKEYLRAEHDVVDILVESLQDYL